MCGLGLVHQRVPAVRRILLALCVLGCDTSDEPTAAGESCSDVRAAILDECEELYQTRETLAEEFSSLIQSGAPEKQVRRIEAEYQQAGEDYRWCVRAMGGEDVTNATGEFFAAEVVAYCDHDSPAGDRWCPEAEIGCEL
jgi:hypothetical protein